MTSEETPEPHKRRVRYKGKNPRRFEEKYKELNPERYADTVAHVLAGGKTPAGQPGRQPGAVRVARVEIAY